MLVPTTHNNTIATTTVEKPALNDTIRVSDTLLAESRALLASLGHTNEVIDHHLRAPMTRIGLLSQHSQSHTK